MAISTRVRARRHMGYDYELKIKYQHSFDDFLHEIRKCSRNVDVTGRGSDVNEEITADPKELTGSIEETVENESVILIVGVGSKVEWDMVADIVPCSHWWKNWLVSFWIETFDKATGLLSCSLRDSVVFPIVAGFHPASLCSTSTYSREERRNLFPPSVFLQPR